MAIEIPKKLKVTIFPNTPQEETVEVEIIDVTKMLTFPEITRPEETLAVTYVRGLYPPSVIWIPVREFSKDRLKDEIIKDIEGGAAPPEKFVIE